MGRYETVVIDPPWTVKNNLTDTRYYRTGKRMPYKMMADKEIEDFLDLRLCFNALRPIYVDYHIKNP
jgi:hypothetical protein